MTDVKQVAEKEAVAAKMTLRGYIMKRPLTWVIVALAVGLIIGHVV